MNITKEMIRNIVARTYPKEIIEFVTDGWWAALEREAASSGVLPEGVRIRSEKQIIPSQEKYVMGTTRPTSSKFSSRAEVLAARRSPRGCCEANANYNSCDCLEKVTCSICSNPNCTDQGGKH